MAFEIVMDKLGANRIEVRSMRKAFDSRTPAGQVDLEMQVTAERQRSVEAPQMDRIVRLYCRATHGKLLADITAEDVHRAVVTKVFKGQRSRSKRTRSNEADILQRLLVRAYIAAGQTPAEAEATARDLLAPAKNAIEAEPDEAEDIEANGEEEQDEDTQDEDARRGKKLLQSERRELLRRLPEEFTGFELLLVTLIVLLLLANGGRFAGLEKLRISDIRYQSDGVTPLYIKGTKGKRKKRRINWIVKTFSTHLDAYLQQHGAFQGTNQKSRKALLLVQPGDVKLGALDPDWLRKMWRKLSHIVGRPIGPQAFRRFYATTRAAAGHQGRSTSRSMGQTGDGRMRIVYVEFEDEDVADQARSRGLQPIHGQFCVKCKHVNGWSGFLCARCEKPLRSNGDTDEAMVDAFLEA